MKIKKTLGCEVVKVSGSKGFQIVSKNPLSVVFSSLLGNKFDGHMYCDSKICGAQGHNENCINVSNYI